MKEKSVMFGKREVVGIAIGVLGVAAFLILYGKSMLGDHTGWWIFVRIQQEIGMWGVILINVMLFSLFLFFLSFRRRSQWRSAGVYFGFIIALFSEMFGIPLTIYLLSPFLGDIPWIGWGGRLRFFPMEWMQIGTVITLIGIGLVIVGWRKLYYEKGLVTCGIYKYMRHPQYTGILLVTLGWVIHFPTVITLIMWPILVATYYRLAKQEERELEKEFGEEFRRYRQRVPMFISPKLRKFW